MKNIAKRFFALAVVFTLSLGVLAGCTSTSKEDTQTGVDSKTTENKEETVIRVAYFPFSIWNDQFLVGYQKGFLDEAFAGNNVKVELVEFENGPAANEAFIAGDIDFVNGIGDQPIIIGIGNGVETTIVSGAAKQGENIGIISPENAGISDVNDFKGKKIGVFVGTYVHKSLIGILNDAGIDEKDVNIVNITSTSDADAAFESGDIDGYLAMNADYIHDKVENQGFIKVADCSKHPAYSYNVVSNKFLEEHPDELEKLVEALYKAEQWIKENEEEAYEVVAEFSGFEVERVKNTNKDADRTIIWDEDYEKNLKETYDFLETHDMITNELTEEEIKNHIDTSFLDKAVAK